MVIVVFRVILKDEDLLSLLVVEKNVRAFKGVGDFVKEDVNCEISGVAVLIFGIRPSVDSLIMEVVVSLAVSDSVFSV